MTDKVPPTLVEPIWERQPEEGARPYADFVLYCEMGPLRSLAKVALKSDKSKAAIEKSSRLWRWQQRVEAFDREQDTERSAQRKVAMREASDRHLAIAKALADKLKAAIESMDASDIKPQMIANLLDTTVKVERLALGMTTASLEHAGPDGGPLQVLHDAKQRLASLLGAVVADREKSTVDSEPDPR